MQSRILWYAQKESGIVIFTIAIHTLIIVEYVLCLQGSNASTECVFSHITILLTKEKTQLHVSTLKALLITKLNLFGSLWTIQIN